MFFSIVKKIIVFQITSEKKVIIALKKNWMKRKLTRD